MSQDPFDVVVVGSGAGGGMAAYVLTQAGARVALLEAGPIWWPDPHADRWKWNYASPRRGGPTRLGPFGEFDAGDGGWDIEGEPYTRARGTQFDWYRARMLGGRTNHWGRISLRFGPDDFRRRSWDGLGDDWPISYDDLRPCYDRVDRLIGVCGSVEGLSNEPDGIFLPPPRPRCWELVVKEAADRLGITCIPSRLSILTRPLNGRPATTVASATAAAPPMPTSRVSGPADRSSGRPRLARSRVPSALGSAVSRPWISRADGPPRCDRMAGPGGARAEPGRRVFRSVSRPGRGGVLVQQDGDEGSRLPRKHICSEWTGCPAEQLARLRLGGEE